MTLDPEIDGRDPVTGQFLPGHRFWVNFSKHGSDPRWPTPQDLWLDAERYFEWVHANPLVEEILHGKDAHRIEVTKMRAMTIQGFCNFIGMTDRRWRQLREKADEDMYEMMRLVEQMMFQWDVEGAASDMLNQNIVSRLLGLAEKTAVADPLDGPAEIGELTDMERARRLVFFMRKVAEEQEKDLIDAPKS